MQTSHTAATPKLLRAAFFLGDHISLRDIVRRWGAGLLCMLSPAAFAAAALTPQGPGASALPEALEEGLRSPQAEKRRVCVSRLALEGSLPAWRLVLGALRDREPEVADEAELSLSLISEERAWRELIGRNGLQHEDEWVRLRCVGALGRGSLPVDAGVLTRAVDPRAVELSRVALAMLERIQAAGRLTGDLPATARTLTRWIDARGPGELRAGALLALQRLDFFEAQPRAERALIDRDAVVRLAAVLFFARTTEQEGLDIARRMLADPDGRVRAACIDVLRTIDSRASILALIEHMQSEPRSRLRWEILGWLRARSGQEHGFDPQPWREWAQTVQGRLVTGVDAARRGPLGQSSVAFAGLTVVSDRIAFLIDLSGSLWQAKVGDKTRKQIVDEQLRAVLKALPEGTRFNVIPYTGTPLPWERQLVASTPANITRAITDFERCHQSGRGNFYDAARLAMEDPEVDTICVLTDGVPTGGRRWNMDLMVEVLEEHHRLRRVAIDSVLVDSPRRQRAAWARLAERTGGRCIQVETAAPPRDPSQAADKDSPGPRAGRGGA